MKKDVVVDNFEEGLGYAEQFGYPIVVKRYHSSFSIVAMGVATDREELLDLLEKTFKSFCSGKGKVSLGSPR